ncbi:MAG: hypothetical protein JO282_04815 [Alphaproteobacteria bacterium]|nr:hypothetical protein [Alphaproteobacteria bacterium]
MPSLFAAIARIFDDNRGTSAALVAIALPVLIGFGALGAETGVWFTIKLQNQSGADAAAISAAYELIAGKTDATSDLTPAANEEATRNGYKGSTPAVIYPYSDTIVSNGVAVTLQQTQAALLAAMFVTEVSVATKAVATVKVFDNPCILALGGSGTDLDVQANTHLDLPNCSAVANSIGASAIALHDTTSSVTAATLVTAGEVSLQGNPIDPAAPPREFTLAFPAMIGAPSVADPYAGILTHSRLTSGTQMLSSCGPITATAGGSCKESGSKLSNTTITPVTLRPNTLINGNWSIPATHKVVLSPGTYWVTGNLTVYGTLQGQGVTMILTLNTQTNKVGALTFASGATIHLSAPGSGPFAGIVLIQDSNGLPAGWSYTSTTSRIDGTAGATLNGLVYFPKASVTSFHGNPSAAGPRCLLLVVNSLNVNALSSVDSAGCASAGLANLPTLSTVALAE